MNLGNVIDSLTEKGICPSRIWLGNCIQFLQDHFGDEISYDDLIDSIYQQWLCSDLSSFENTKPLPADVTGQEKVTLHGVFHVQVTDCLNIGCSKLSQYQKITKTQNEDEAVRDGFPSWEPTAKRTLYMTVSDGSKSLHALEHKPLKSFPDVIAPGAKLLLHGDICCRKQILMLTEDNVKLLGGFVQELKEHYSLPKILARSLNLPIPTEGSNKGPAIPSDSENRTHQNFSVQQEPDLQPLTFHAATREGTSREDAGPSRIVVAGLVHQKFNVPLRNPNPEGAWDPPDIASYPQMLGVEDSDEERGFGPPIASSTQIAIRPDKTQTKRQRLDLDLDLRWRSEEEIRASSVPSTSQIPAEHMQTSDSFEESPATSQQDYYFGTGVLAGEERAEEVSSGRDIGWSDPFQTIRNDRPLFDDDGMNILIFEPPEEQSETQINFTYLLDVFQSMRFSSVPQKRKIRAAVVNVEEALSPNGGSYWSIRVKINDGTCAVICGMDDLFLCRQLEVTAAEALAIRQTRDQRSIAQAQRCLANFQIFLKRLDLEFDIQFFPQDTVSAETKLPVIMDAVSLCRNLSATMRK